MVNEFFTLIRDSEAKTKNPVNCLPGVLDTVICAESAHLKKKKKSDPKKYPPLEQFLYPLSVGSTCLAALRLRFKAVFIFSG